MYYYCTRNSVTPEYINIAGKIAAAVSTRSLHTSRLESGCRAALMLSNTPDTFDSNANSATASPSGTPLPKRPKPISVRPLLSNLPEGGAGGGGGLIA